MTYLHVQELKKYFGVRELFSDVSFDIYERDHVGLVGVNGCGKSTLIRMLTGEEPIDGGQISFGKLVRVASLDQSPVWEKNETLLTAVLHCFDHLFRMEEQLNELADRLASGDVSDALIGRQAALQDRYEREGGMTFRSRARSTLLGLGFTEEELESKVENMSGGQMRKAALAKILLSDADLLLLDEPTNHLDIASLEWLEDYLKGFRGSYIVISHDRYFLDSVTERTLSLENRTLTAFHGSYTAFVEHKMDERAYAMRRYNNDLREIKRIEGIIAQQRRWNQARNYVTIASKEKQIERLKKQMVKPEALPDEIRFDLHADELTANEVVICRHLRKQYGSKVLFDDLNLLIRNGERVCLIGENGCGKTTLMKILMGEVEPDSGTATLGTGVRVGYFAQSTVQNESQQTVLDYVCDLFPRELPQRIRGLLGIFLFHGDDVFKPLNTLSGGELARIQLMILMLRGSNVLFLDEPTNHLDISSCEALEDAIAAYGGTMLIITHDRYLANRIADRMILMNSRGLTEFAGDWDAYKRLLREQAAEQAAVEKPAPQNDYLRKKELRAERARLRSQRDRAEKEIAALEAEKNAVEAQLAAPSAQQDYEKLSALYLSVETLGKKLEAAYDAWERAEAELAAAEETEE